MNLSRIFPVGLFGILFLVLLANVSFADTVVSCSDSDGGAFTPLKGTTKWTNESNKSWSLEDKCVGGTLYEWYCDYSKTSLSGLFTYECAQNGTKCQEGACVKAVTATCSDSDGGNVVGTKGTLSVTNSTGTFSYSDSCGSATALTEYYCEGTNATISWPSCPSDTSCKDGACVKVETTPTPSAPVTCKLNNLPASTSKKNKATCSNGSVFEDFCIDNATLLDYKVTSNSVSGKTVNCAVSKKICNDGACEKTSSGATCTDTDGGIATAVKGTVSYKELWATEPTVKEDSCTKSDTVMEWYCDTKTNLGKKKSVKCPSGFLCSDGACVEYGESGGTSNNTSGQLKKKSPLREFLMAAGFDDFAYLYAPSTDAKSRMAKSWKIGKGNILSEIFLYDFEPIEIANPSE